MEKPNQTKRKYKTNTFWILFLFQVSTFKYTDRRCKLAIFQCLSPKLILHTSEFGSGVCKVDIIAEEHKVIVTGIVNPSTLVKKLAKYGKHAEICNEGYNQEHTNYDKGNNDNQVQYITNGPNAFENQYMIPTFFGKDHWGPEWCQDIGVKTTESEINQHLAAPLFLENVNNMINQDFTRINENPKWQESMIPPMMHPASFQENCGTNYSGIGNQEGAHNLLGVSSFGQYIYQPSHMANTHRFYHDCHPSKIMQQSSYNHAPEGINLHMQETPTRNDVMMNAYMHHHMTNQNYFSLPFNLYSYWGLEIA